MAPIRVGIIGLSTAENLHGPGSWAVLSHLPALQQLSEEYEIVAIANSTTDSAQRSISAYGLPSSTRAYGSAEDIAKDPDVDLIVVSVRVQKHFELAKPALLQGKNVFIEWPVAANMAQVEELGKLAKAGGIRVIVGLQTRAAPMIRKVKEIIASGKIGRIVSSSLLFCSTRHFLDPWPESMKYLLDISSGGNEFTIMFGHVLDSFTHVIGDISQIQSIVKTEHKTVRLGRKDGTIIDPVYPKTAPDQIAVQGTTDSGAMVSISFRSPRTNADDKDVRWYISGSEGEIMITAPAAWTIQDKEAEITVKIGQEPAEKVEYLEYRVPEMENVSALAVNSIPMYRAYAIDDKTVYATIESAINTHRLLDEIMRVAIKD